MYDFSCPVNSNHRHRKGLVTDVSGPQRNACTGTLIARDLREQFPGSNGFSAANLWRMKNFDEAYGNSEKLAQRVREISWSHSITILEQCKSNEERERYIRNCRRYSVQFGL
jgi:predicted nuclease of restriction endonuclease-like (RecB) superfamily